MIRFLVASAFVAVFTSSAVADKDQVWTLTNFDCADWTKAHANEDKRFVAALEGYVFGYLSARAVLLGTNHLKGIDVDAVTKEVSRQCSFRPAANLGEISLVVAHQLEGQ
jgi:hypothetical protein